MGTTNGDYYFLRGGGEMGELIRAKDWSKTALGDPSNWPQSLCTIVAVMLDNPFGMYIAWGSEYTQLYNDGYRPILGAIKHPQALGISTRETFSEIWYIIESMFDGVMKGKAVGVTDFMFRLNRYGYDEECYFDFAYSPIRKDNGEVGGILVTVIETTEKKRATEALMESNARFINNIMQAPVAMCIFRGENYVVEIANEQMLNLWGKHADQVMNKPIFEGLPEAKDQGLEPLLNSVFTTGEKFVANERPVDLPRNGKVETTYINFVYEALKDPDGTISGIVAIAIEVTPQVISRSRIEENEQKVRALVENAPFPIAVYVGKEMIVELANQSIIDIWGKGNDVIGKSFKEVLPELDNQSVFEQIQKVLETGESFHTKNTPLDLIIDGKPYTYYFNYSFTPLYDISGNIYGVMNTGVDLTELNIAKKRIEKSDKRFRNTMKQAPVGITILRGPEYIVEMANVAYLQLVDKEEAELVGIPLFASLPEVEQAVHSLLDNVLNTGVPYHGNEVPIPVNRYGKQDLFYFDFLYHPLKEEDGKISGVIAIVTEVTEKVEARKKVEDSEKRYNLMLMQSPFAFLILKGKDMVVHLANDSMKEVLGKGSDIEGKPILEVLPEIKGQPFPDLLDNVYNTGIPFSANEMLAQLTQNGKLENVYFNYVYQPYYETDKTISGVTVIAYDVTSSVIANKKIEESKQKLDIVIDASELGTYELNLITDEVIYSDKYLEIFGFGKGTVPTHKELIDRLHPTEMQMRNMAFKDSLVSGTLFYQAKVIWNDKTMHWIEVKGKVFFNEEKKPVKLIGTVGDITEEKVQKHELQESESKFRLLADSMPQQIWTSDPEGNLNYYNQSVFDYSGLNLEQINKDGWIQIVHADDREENIKHWINSITTGKDFLFEHRFRRRDGEYRWQLSRAIPQRDETSKIQMWVGTSTDIQDQKTREEKKDEFISIASHEMKTPLTTAKAYLQMLELLLDENNEDASLYAKKANQSVNRLNELISELLDVSKIRLGKLNYTVTTFNFNELIESTVENIQLTSLTHSIIKTGQVNDTVTGDKDRLQQVVINLLTNAIKYSPGAEKVFINLAQEKDSITVTVKDAGIGIAQQSLDKIFEKYHRVEEHAVHFQGLGIGLFISYEIIQRHHGRLWAESKPGKGSTFYFTIPVNSNL
jgi:PAS domain S-box-containing protein